MRDIEELRRRAGLLVIPKEIFFDSGYANCADVEKIMVESMIEPITWTATGPINSSFHAPLVTRGPRWIFREKENDE